MHSSVISGRGQTTLPKPIRKALGIKAGDEIRYLVFDDGVRIVPVRPIHRLFGALKREGPAAVSGDLDAAAAGESAS